jgi:hypothetical protein
VLTGREIERLCRNDPAAAARLAIDLATERVTFKRPTSEQALLLTGATVQGYCHANQLMRASAKSR